MVGFALVGVAGVVDFGVVVVARQSTPQRRMYARPGGSSVPSSSTSLDWYIFSSALYAPHTENQAYLVGGEGDVEGDVEGKG